MQALLEAATKGPWTIDRDWTIEVSGSGQLIGKLPLTHANGEADAALIVALVNAAPALLAVARAARGFWNRCQCMRNGPAYCSACINLLEAFGALDGVSQ